MKKVLLFLLFICFMPFVGAKSYLDLVGTYSSNDFVDMPVAYQLNNGNRLLAGKTNNIPFIKVINANGGTVKNVNIPYSDSMSFYNIYKIKGYYYIYGGYYSVGGANIHIISYKVDKNYNFVERKQYDFAETSPYREYTGKKETMDFFYDFGADVRINKETGEFSAIPASEFPSFLANRNTIIKQLVDDTASVDLVYNYMDGVAVLYRTKANETTKFYIGYVVNDELKWSKEASGVDYYKMNTYSDFIVTVTFDEPVGYVLRLYDKTGNVVYTENFSHWHNGNMSGAFVRGGTDYLNVFVNVPITNNSESSAMYFFKNTKHQYDIYLKDIENGTIIPSKLKAEEDEVVDVDTISSEGYVLGEIHIVGNDGEDLSFNNNSFVMPDSSVVITAKFVAGTENDSSEIPTNTANNEEANDTNADQQANPNTSSQTMYIILFGAVIALGVVIVCGARKLKMLK